MALQIQTICIAGVIAVSYATSLSRLYEYTFEAASFSEASFGATTSPVVLSGRSPKECDPPMDFTDKNVSYVALALTDKGQGCYTSVAYSNGDFPIALGAVSMGDQSFDAFEIKPPQAAATSFAASGQNLYLYLSGPSQHTLYRLEDGVLIPIATVQAAAAGFTPTGVTVEGLSVATVFVLLPTTQVVPSPSKRTLSGKQATECDGVFPESAIFGDVTPVLMRQVQSSGGGSCWNDARYSNSDYLMEQGQLTGTDGNSLTALRISPPNKTATEFVASKTNLYIRQSGQDTKVWTYSASGFRLLSTVVASSAENFTDTGIVLSSLSEALLVILQPSSVRMSIWPLESGEVEAAYLDGAADGSFSVSARRFTVPGQPFTTHDWAHGPGTHTGNYGTYKRFFVTAHADGREGVVWQDFTGQAVKLTWLASDYLSSETVQLTPLSSTLFVGAVGDGQGNVVVLLGGSATPATKQDTTTAEVVKFNAAGTEVERASLSTAKADLNIYSFSSSGASFAWDTDSGTIGVSLARTMTMASDDLNHQGGIAFVLNATTLQMITNYGQTSGHSFANSLLVSQQADRYLGMDLGDNYPRGINLWDFKASSRSWTKRLVYEFKTKHGTSAKSPAQATYPVYAEISTDPQTYYQWSNDNYLYTELAHPGLHESNGTVLVFFAGEAPPLDNSQVGSALNVARNVGFVKIPRDLSSQEVLSPGEEETGGFYTFGGTWSAQTNRGISFLTSKTDIATSVSRLKTAELGGSILLLWEVWSATAYSRSELMIVSTNGDVLQAETPLSFPVQLPFADDVVLRDGKAIAYVGSPTGQLMRFEMCYQNCALPSGGGTGADSSTTSGSGDQPGADSSTTSGSGDQPGDESSTSAATAGTGTPSLRLTLLSVLLTGAVVPILSKTS